MGRLSVSKSHPGSSPSLFHVYTHSPNSCDQADPSSRPRCITSTPYSGPAKGPEKQAEGKMGDDQGEVKVPGR